MPKAAKGNGEISEEAKPRRDGVVKPALEYLETVVFSYRFVSTCTRQGASRETSEQLNSNLTVKITINRIYLGGITDKLTN